MPAAAYADPAELIRRGVAETFTPREALTLDQWCDRHAVLPSEGTGSARAGRWDTDNTPYLREVMRRMHDPEVTELTVWKSAQTGATVGLIVNDALYQIAELRQPVLIVYPTKTKGKDVNKRKLIPALEHCEPTKRLIQRARDITDTEINLGGVPLWFAYTQSDSQMRSDSVAQIRFDELDVCEGTGLNDPIEEARKRQTTFHRRLLFKTSTPERVESGVIYEYQSSAVRWTFQVPCPFTGRFFELFTFDQLGWFGGIEADPERVRANCWVVSPFGEPGEQLRIGEHCKAWMVRNGIWVTQDEQVESDGSILETLDRVTGREVGLEGQPGFKNIGRLTSDFFRTADQEPDRRKRDAGMEHAHAERLRDRLGVRIVGHRNRGQTHGYRFNALVSLIDAEGWGGIAHAFVKSKGNPSDTWRKQTLAQVPTIVQDRVEITRLESLCLGHPEGHEHGEVPEWAFATATICDVQKDCIKAGVWAYGPEAIDRALVYTVVIPRDPDKFLREPRLREQLRSIELRRKHSDLRVKPVATFIDSGHFTEEVYELVRWLKRSGSWAWPVKGTGSDVSDRKVWRTAVTDKNLPDGRREKRPDPIELVHFSDPYLSALFVSRVTAVPDAETGELTALGDAELTMEQLTPGRVTLPGRKGWDLADEVIAEMANVERVLCGIGSGRKGEDGRGRRRMEFRKRYSFRPNDWFDVGKMNQIPVRVLQLDRMTPEAIARMMAWASPATQEPSRTEPEHRREEARDEPIAVRLARLNAMRGRGI